MAASTTPDLFLTLPLELKQKIFHLGATNNGNDIRVAFEDEKDFRDLNPKLDAPVLDIVLKAKETSPVAYEQVLDYFTRPIMQWTFVSETMPHRFLLRAFKKQAPQELLKRIQNVFLPKVTLRGYSELAPVLRPDDGSITHLPLVLESNPSAYVSALEGVLRPDKALIKHQIDGDISAGLSLFVVMFPALTQLDIGTDIMDLVEYGAYCVNNVHRGFSHADFWLRSGPVFRFLDVLKAGRDLSKLELRFFWNDFLHTGPRLSKPWDEIRKEQAEVKAIEVLANKIPAKSITGYRVG